MPKVFISYSHDSTPHKRWVSELATQLQNNGIDTILDQWELPHSIAFRGKGYHPSAKASRGEDLDIEEPVPCRYASAFHFHATLPRMLSSTLIGDEIVQVGEPREKRLLASLEM